jgi:hypothetical protein
MTAMPNLAPAPAELLSLDDWVGRLPLERDVAVFQNVYEDAVAGMVDPAFLPVDGRHHSRTETREIGLFLRMFHSGLYAAAPLTGIVSPKFQEKTKIAGATFLSFIANHPGYNVYFINPFPQNAYFTYNVWDQGELCHPGLAALAELLFEQAGYDTDVLHRPRDTQATLLYASYWVGDRRFWCGYMQFITRLLDAQRALSPEIRQRLLADDPQYPDPVPILSFIFERTFSTYLHLNPDIRALPYPFLRDDIQKYCNVIELELVESFGDVVDDIDRRGQYTHADRNIFAGLTRLHAAAARRNWR